MIKDSEKRYYGQSPVELLDALRKDAQIDSIVHEEIKAAISFAVSSSLVGAIDRHERAESKLAGRLLALNILLGLFTVTGTILAVVAFLQNSPQ